MRFTNKSLACAVGGVVFAGWLIVQQTSSVAHAGRSLTLREAWSLHGGSNQTCADQWGNCYAPPGDCIEATEEDCDSTLSFSNLGNNSLTCRASNDPEDHCEANGQQPCVYGTFCARVVNNGVYLNCAPTAWIPLQNGPVSVTTYTTCQ
jgi:hypothetical protein